MWSIKNRLIISFLIGINVNSAFADLINTPTVDRPPELSRTLTHTTYSDTTKVGEDNESSQTVLPEDYKRLKIKPLYRDSKIQFYPKEKEYYETRIFPNNILMIRIVGTNSATFLDLDLDTKDGLEKSWILNCSMDNITDEKICIINKFEFALLKSSKTGLMLTVNKNISRLNPYRFHYLRIDKNPPLKTKLIFTGPTVQTIVNQMKKGEMLYTRFYEGANSHDQTMTLYGFSPAYETMNLIYSQMK